MPKPKSLSFLTLCMFAGLAFAQAPQQQAGAAPASIGSVVLEKASDIPDAEKTRRSTDALNRMRQTLKDVLARLEEARNSRDVVQLNCVNEKLTQIKGLLRISEQADVALQEAISKRESGAADHEFTKVSIAHQKVEQLRAESEECIGQLAFRTDENLTVEVEVPEDLPSGDPTQPAAPSLIQTRPPPASPSL